MGRNYRLGYRALFPDGTEPKVRMGYVLTRSSIPLMLYIYLYNSELVTQFLRGYASDL